MNRQWRLASGYSLRMCARHVDSTNPGRSNLVFRSKPIPEAEMSNRLIKDFNSRDHITPTLKQLHWVPIHARIAFKISPSCITTIPQAALEFCQIHCPNGRLGQDLGFGGIAFALKLPELLNRNLAAVRAKIGQTSCFPNGPQIWCPIGQ